MSPSHRSIHYVRTVWRHPFKIGQQTDIGAATVSVLQLGDTGPSKIRVVFHRPMQALTFLAWKDGRPRKTPLPEVGEAAILPKASPF